MRLILGHRHVPSPIWWLRASDLALSVGDPVTDWLDRTPNHYDVAQADATKQPIFSDSYNSGSGLFDGPFRVVKFPGVIVGVGPYYHGYTYLIGGNYPLLDNFGTMTFYVVGRAKADFASDVVFASKGDSSFNPLWWFDATEVGAFFDVGGVDELRAKTSVDYSSTPDYHIFTMTKDSNTLGMYVNGVYDTVVLNPGPVGSFANSGNVYVGAVYSGSLITYALLGEIAEIRAYAGAHDATTRALIQGELNAVYHLF